MAALCMCQVYNSPHKGGGNLKSVHLHEPRRNGKRISVAIKEADHLQAKRHATVLEQRQRQRRYAKYRRRHAEFRVAGRVEPLRRCTWRGERDAAVAKRGKFRMDGTDAGALLEIGTVIGERQTIELVGALPRDRAELAGVTLAHGAEEPLTLEAIDAVRKLRDVR